MCPLIVCDVKCSKDLNIGTLTRMSIRLIDHRFHGNDCYFLKARFLLNAYILLTILVHLLSFNWSDISRLSMFLMIN